MAVAEVRKVGGSLIVTIPKEVVKAEAFQPGEVVRIKVLEAKRSWFGAARGVGPFTVEDERRAYDEELHC